MPHTVGDLPQYPTFTYSDDEELPIPCCGKMLVEFEETRKEKEVRNGEVRYTCTISVKKIISVEADPEEEKEERADDALDRIAKSEGYDKDGDDDGDEDKD